MSFSEIVQMFLVTSIIAVCCVGFISAAPNEKFYENRTSFFLWNSDAPGTWQIVGPNSSGYDDGCDTSGNFSVIVHGWLETSDTPWVSITVENLLKFRKGCVYVMDYSKMSNTPDFFALKYHFNGFAEVLKKKFLAIDNFDRQYCFGFSLGARICIEAGKKVGNQVIERMDLCDPVGPAFNMQKDPRSAAKNVACIHTSSDKGTFINNCHQDFRMGYCGYWQPGAKKHPMTSHGLCPYFYNLAFRNDFVPNNVYKCQSPRLAKNLSNAVKMGYLADFDRTIIRGDIFIATSNLPPYVVYNQTIDNDFDNLLTWF